MNTLSCKNKSEPEQIHSMFRDNNKGDRTPDLIAKQIIDPAALMEFTYTHIACD